MTLLFFPDIWHGWDGVQVVGEYHLGDMVNRFQHGSLVMQLPDNETAQIPTLLFGTILGIIGVIASLPRERFLFLEKLQVSIQQHHIRLSTCLHCKLFFAYSGPCQRALLVGACCKMLWPKRFRASHACHRILVQSLAIKRYLQA